MRLDILSITSFKQNSIDTSLGKNEEIPSLELENQV